MPSIFAEKIKEAFISVFPVLLIVVALHYTIAPLAPGQLTQFLVGGALIICGLGVFLQGAEIGLIPFGQKVGSSLTYLRRLALMLLAAFAIGFAITIAEPDVQVLAAQVNQIAPVVHKTKLLVAIGLGVGFFTLLGLVRVVLRLPLRLLLLFFYLLVFLLCSQVESGMVGVAFDSGGATTGPITVPFIMALGLGVAATTKKHEGDDNGFGLVGMASIGPIMAVALMSVLGGAQMRVEEAGAENSSAAAISLSHFLEVLPEVTRDILMALVPIVLIFIFFQLVLLRLPRRQVIRMLTGFVYTFAGLVLFMTGVHGGFSPVGQFLGQSLGAYGAAALIPVGLMLGAVVVCAEPAVWILTAQVQELSGGHIRQAIMLAALSLSVALAVMMGMIRVSTGLSIWYFLVPGYAAALILAFLGPSLFTAIAFDSGGVASGPMSATFVLSLTLGASISSGGNPATDAFGMVAMIAMAPLVTIQLLGLIFKRKQRLAEEAARAGHQ